MTASIRVLHVEDEPGLADVVATYLEREDERIAVQSALNPEEARQLLADAEIDCIVSDYEMPGENGIQFLETVREEYPDLPFILYTGKGSEEIASDAISAGVTDYLQKATGSSQFTVLANRIENVVNQYRSREAIEETEQKLTELAERTDDVLFMFDGDWNELLFVNSAYEALWDRSIAELEADPKSFLDQIHPDDLQTVLTAMEQLMDGRPCRTEYRIRRPDGQRWVRSSAKPVLNDGTVARIVGQVRDVTEQKERQLQLETIIDNLPGYVYRHRYEPEYPLAFVMGDSESITGYTATELEDDIGLAEEVIDPRDREALWEELLTDVEATGSYDATYRITTKDGENRWIRDQGQLVEDPVIGTEVLDGLITDVTEQKQQEKQLVRMSELLRHTEKLTDIGGWEANAETGVQRWTDGTYRIHGLDPEGAFDPTVEAGIEFYHPDDREKIEAAVTRCLAEGEPYDGEYRLITDTGSVRWVQTVGVPVWEDGEIVGARGAIQDVTEQKQQEQQLRELSQFQEAVIQSANVWINVLNERGEVVLWNEAAAQISGYSEAEVTGQKDLWELLYPDPEYRKDVREQAEEILAGEDAAEGYETVITTKDGNERVISWNSHQISDEAGEFSGSVAIGWDITERKQQEQELERVRELLAEAERLGNLGAWEFDANGNASWTDGTYRIHGVDDEFEPTIESGLEFIHPEDRPRIEAAVNEALESGESYDIEARLITADGEERWVRATGELQDDGETVRGYIQDITDYETNRRDVATSEERLRLALEGGEMGMWELDLQSRVSSARSPQHDRIFGYEEPLDEWRFETFLDHIHPDDREAVKRSFEEAIETGRGEIECRIIRADGEERWIAVEGKFSVKNDGTPERAVGLVEDITERKKREQQLDQFASIVSHDLRNPLNVAILRLELAREDCTSEHLDDIERAHERMGSLIEDLLTLAREENIEADHEPVDVARVVEDCWANVETADATLVTSIERPIIADESRLKQLFENLIRNAVEHGGSDVTVTVGELSSGFYIEDDGHGVHEDEREDVFEPGHSSSVDGTGFGLSIVRQIVEAHGWEICVTDGAAGGARFEITGVEFADD